MPDDRTVLDHLLEGREALEREVERLTAAIAELDTVIGQIGGASRRVAAPNGAGVGADQPVNPPAEVEPEAVEPAPTGRPRQSRPAAKRTASGRGTRGAATGAAAGSAAEAPKSIRMHVLDMLAAEDRDFGLAEIIDRVHEAGIQAHDDAVRSITIKLMKDGRVERVGRGQYRLARRSAARSGSASASTPAAPEQPEATSAPPPEPEPETYTPPLNLGQPWDTGI